MNPGILASEFMLLTFLVICCGSKAERASLRASQPESLAPLHSPLPNLFSASAFYASNFVRPYLSVYLYAACLPHDTANTAWGSH